MGEGTCVKVWVSVWEVGEDVWVRVSEGVWVRVSEGV